MGQQAADSYDICVVGAGVAGAAMAAYMADHGFRVVVVEKDMHEQDRIVGELMQPGGVNQLREMRLEYVLDGYDVQPITGYALFMNGHHFTIEYPGGETGRGLRNGKLLGQMRAYLLSHACVTVIEGTVVNLVENENKITGIRYIPKGTENTSSITASLTVVCDGMFSSFRDALSDSSKTVSSYFLGLLLHDCKLPFPNHGHVIAAEPLPLLIYPVSSTETRVLIDFPADQPPRRGDDLSIYLREQIGPQMPAEIQPSYYKAVKEGKFKVMPNHLIPAKPKLKSGAVLVGDSLNMRHPLTGGGMTVALTDVHHLGDRLIAIRNNFTKDNIDAAVESFYDKRNAQNASINILADALYKVMSDKDLKEACYSYLQLGGKRSSIPLSLLAAVNRNNRKLLQHFFGVAIHGVRRILFPLPSMAGIGRSYRMIKNAVHIVSPLVIDQKPGPIIKITFTLANKIFP